MIKQDIVDNVANATGLTKVEVEAVLNESFSAIITALSNNEKIELRGFGIFDVKDREARIARNPKNGSAVAVPAKKVPFFRMGKGMKERINR